MKTAYDLLLDATFRKHCRGGKGSERAMTHLRVATRLLVITLLVTWMAACGSKTEGSEVILLTTTTTQDSGILAALIQGFESSHPYKVKAIVAGSGDVLKQAAAGEGDVLLTHSPEAEIEWMQKGYGTSRRLVMYNDFVIAGPAADAAGIRGLAPDVALRQIADRGAVFVSRGDQSGTHVRELKLWKAAAFDPKGKSWYRETGQGQGLTMEVASQQGGYVLTDRGTFLVHQQRLGLAILVEGDPRLRNIYHVMTVDSSKFPRVNSAGGRATADFLVGPEGQRIIGEFGCDRFGQALFTAVGHLTDEQLAAGGAKLMEDWSYWSDLGAGFLGAFRLLFGGDPETWGVIRQSLLISSSATALALLVGLPLGAWLALSRFRGRGMLLTALNAGFGMPPVVVGLVLSLLLLRHGPLGELNLRFTPMAVIMAQFILCLPIVASLTASSIASLNPRLRLQLEALGASRLQSMLLMLREIRVQLLVVGMAAFGGIISEVGASTMVGGNLPGSTRTMTTAIVMETGMGHYDRALAYSFILLLLVLVAFGFLTRFQHREAAA